MSKWCASKKIVNEPSVVAFIIPHSYCHVGIFLRFSNNQLRGYKEKYLVRDEVLPSFMLYLFKCLVLKVNTTLLRNLRPLSAIRKKHLSISTHIFKEIFVIVFFDIVYFLSVQICFLYISLGVIEALDSF